MLTLAGKFPRAESINTQAVNLWTIGIALSRLPNIRAVAVLRASKIHM